MGKIIINKLKYIGDNYIYESPLLSEGINIILGDNGTGKSTFTYLVFFALGNNLPYFKKESLTPLKEIVNDTNGRVKLNLTINNKKFIIIREIYKNEIYVIDGNGENILYPIFRSGTLYENTKKTFSDWILKELQIDTIEISQFNDSHKINFDDLMRLVYYDQITEPNKIYQEAFMTNTNFYNNSSVMKRSIFETLLGTYNKEYYDIYIKIKNLTKEKQEKIIKQNNIEYLIKSLNIFKIKNITESILKQNLLSNDDRIRTIKSDVEKLLKEINKGTVILSEVKKMENKLTEILELKKNIKSDMDELYIDINRGIYLIEEYKKDIDDLNKIILTSENFNFYNLNSCPFCNESIHIEKGKCICGSEHGLNYEKFIFSKNEYSNMVKSKMKSVNLMEETVLSCQDELKEKEIKLGKLDEDYLSVSNSLKNILDSSSQSNNSNTIEQLNKEQIDYMNKNENIRLILDNLSKKINLEKDIKKLTKDLDMEKILLEKKEKEKEEELEENLKIFEEEFTKLMKKLYPEVNKIRLDKSYMPIINEGYYSEASSAVPKKFFYFLSLLKTHLKTDNSYPGFLLIDSISDKGIGIDKLKNMLKILVEEFEKEKNYQIIITSGYDEFPKELGRFVKEQLNKENNRLLKNNHK
ncbi:MAG: hypothetical protein ACRC4T_03470 [Cetobacterium sp.]